MGHAVIGVAVNDHDVKKVVVAVLRKRGADDIHYYARFAIEDL